MPIINLSNPVNALIAIILYILIIFLSKETKKSSFSAIMLLCFLTIIAGNSIEYFMVDGATQAETIKLLANCIAVDFVFVFISFVAFLWMDDIESKERKIKSIDNSLDWFWKKV